MLNSIKSYRYGRGWGDSGDDVSIRIEFGFDDQKAVGPRLEFGWRRQCA